MGDGLLTLLITESERVALAQEKKTQKKRNMEDQIRSSSPLTTTQTKRKREISGMKTHCLYFTTSLQEGFRYFKALFIGLAKKATARNEKEATKADLQTAKMQVEATDEAEYTKKRLHKSM